MNLQEAKEDLLSFLKKTYQYGDEDFTIDESTDNVEIIVIMNMKSIDDSIKVCIFVHKNNIAGVSLTFDRLSKTLRSFDLINQFNQKNFVFKAFINENGYLEFNHVLLSIHTREELMENIPNLMNDVSSDENLKLLVPLANLTYEG
jgi:hypothetical protein